MNGQGIYKYKKEGHIYEGEFRNGMKEGFGVFRFKEGDIYKGQFKNGLKDG